MCLGPQTGLGHNSIIFMIECQANYLIACIKKVLALPPGSASAGSLVPKPAVQSAWTDGIQARLAGLVWSTCASWYNLQGERNVTMWPSVVTEYWWATRKPDWSHFDFGRDADAAWAAWTAARKAGGVAGTAGAAGKVLKST